MKSITSVIIAAAACLYSLAAGAEEPARPEEKAVPEKKIEQEAPKDAAQKDTGRDKVSALFSGINLKGTRFGGYGAFDCRYAKFDGSYGLLTGGRGALVINHGLEIGGAGYGLASGNKVRSLTDKRLVYNTRTDIGYGGLLLNYHFFTTRLFNFSLGAVVGAGGLAVRSPLDWDAHGHHGERYYRQTNPFFIAEPEIHVFMNIFEHGRIGISGSYRLVKGMNKRGVTSGDFGGYAVGVSAQFGVF